MRIKDLITSRICGNTVFENSWIWYCDECRQHGTAMSAEEADYLAHAHLDWNSYALDLEGKIDPETEEVKLYAFWEVSLYERNDYDWEPTCPIYIIDEGNNITYDLGNDYEDKTPNKITNLDTMLKLQRELGLE